MHKNRQIIHITRPDAKPPRKKNAHIPYTISQWKKSGEGKYRLELEYRAFPSSEARTEDFLILLAGRNPEQVEAWIQKQINKLRPIVKMLDKAVIDGVGVNLDNLIPEMAELVAA